LRPATDSSKGNHVANHGNDEQPGLAGDEQQNARAQDQSHQDVHQNSQSKFHGAFLTGFTTKCNSAFIAPGFVSGRKSDFERNRFLINTALCDGESGIRTASRFNGFFFTFLPFSVSLCSLHPALTI
jgi:hypothetical protein